MTSCEQAIACYNEGQTDLDRDGDGVLDRDEIDQCRNPANAASTPTNPSADIDEDGDEDSADVSAFVSVLLGTSPFASHAMRSDMNCDGLTDGRDVTAFVRGYLTP